ncbi:MAG: very short patch repair endonuclease [Pontibacterium sp.]
MVDVHSREVRSKNMAAVRADNTQPEVWLRKKLFARGFRYRLHVKTLPAKPDIVFPKYKAVILVHGCFWHQHNCHLFKLPKTRTAFWAEKLGSNKARDARVVTQLNELGWRVLTVWECALKGRQRLPEAQLLRAVEQWLRFGKGNFNIAGDHVPQR